MIILRNEKEIKKVIKPWGHEIWFAEEGNKDRFAFKKITIKAPYRSSYQFHQKKEETIFISEGEGILHYSDTKINIENFIAKKYSENEILKIISGLNKKNLFPGDCITVRTGFVHSVEATKDLTIFEASTLELDDVFRLNDQFNRPNGHIESEHQ